METYPLSPKNENELLSQYMNFAYGIANSYRSSALPLEDLKQESLLGLLDAYQHFDPSKQVKFSTYSVFWIKKRILASLSSESRSSLQAVELDENSLEDKFQSKPHPQSHASSEVLSLPSDMPLLEKQILILSFEKQLTIREIAQSLGISNEKVRQIRQKALRRLKAKNT
ncbi:MAG: sigma-70 family RNA polymerase sigma factor [Candidatus Cloacimonetes bacterium]|nr:sigma-70 family RNA polymerase sigma factor [Candidatus Cloacimonadota bacterium]